MIKSQFNYCPLFWMFCSRKSYNLVNKVQEKALRLTCKDDENNFQTLITENNETFKHRRNLEFLKTEIIYKIKNNHPSPIMHHLFKFRENNFNLRELVTHNKETSNYGLETAFQSAVSLNCHLNIKTQHLEANLQNRIKNWKGGETCPWRLCKDYLPNKGYLT